MEQQSKYEGRGLLSIFNQRINIQRMHFQEYQGDQGGRNDSIMIHCHSQGRRKYCLHCLTQCYKHTTEAIRVINREMTMSDNARLISIKYQLIEIGREQVVNSGKEFLPKRFLYITVWHIETVLRPSFFFFFLVLYLLDETKCLKNHFFTSWGKVSNHNVP